VTHMGLHGSRKCSTGPNQVVRASRRPWSVRLRPSDVSVGQKSRRPVGAATARSTGAPTHQRIERRSVEPDPPMERCRGRRLTEIERTGRASCSRVNTAVGRFR